jgi:hypothetical protein
MVLSILYYLIVQHVCQKYKYLILLMILIYGFGGRFL